jgi:acyl-CoA synthetase (AMP-forming)/AMP-acid ligase II
MMALCRRSWSADEPALILFTLPPAVPKAWNPPTAPFARASSISTHRCSGSHDLAGRIAAIMARQLQPTTLSAVPLFHVSGLHAQLLVSLRHGRRLIFVHRWEPEKAAELIARKSHPVQWCAQHGAAADRARLRAAQLWQSLRCGLWRAGLHLA